MTDPTPVLILLGVLLALAINLVVMYFIIRAGVAAGMKRYELWKRDGSLEVDMVKHAEAAERREQQRIADRQRLGLERDTPS